VPDVFPELTVEPLDPASVAQGLDDLSPDEQDAADAFLSAADEALRPFRCRAEAKKFRPDDLPALYSTTREGRFFRSLEQSKEASGPLWSGVLDNLGRRGRAAPDTAQLCFNFRNPLVRKLAALRERRRLARAVEVLYVHALLLGHHPLNRREMALLNSGMLALLEDCTGD
jgi:molecular chaperone HtpG